MTPIYRTEPKSCRIRRALKPRHNPRLASTVLVFAEGSMAKVYIHVTPALVQCVGSNLPSGICEEHPAYLKLINIPSTDTWRLLATYLDGSAIVFLWQYTSRPEWAPTNI